MYDSVSGTNKHSWVETQDVLRSRDRASLMYLSITNKMRRYTMLFITINALHVLGGSSG